MNESAAPAVDVREPSVEVRVADDVADVAFDGESTRGGERPDDPATASQPSADADVVDDVPVQAGPGGVVALVEAVLMASDGPVSVTVMAAAWQIPTLEVAAALAELQTQYAEQHRGFCLQEVAGGWQLTSRPDLFDAVRRVVAQENTAKLSRAAIETLAIIAYRQPVSRARVSAIRGVSVDAVVRTLLTRGLICEVSTDDETGAVLFATTPLFLEKMGLASLDELPALAPYLPHTDELDEIAGGTP